DSSGDRLPEFALARLGSGRLRHPAEHQVRGTVSRLGNLVASVAGEGFVRLWDSESGREIFRLPGPGKASICTPAFSGNGKALAAAVERDEIGLVCIWELPEAKLRWIRTSTSLFTALSFGNDSNSLWALQQNGEARQWNSKTGNQEN